MWSKVIAIGSSRSLTPKRTRSVRRFRQPRVTAPRRDAMAELILHADGLEAGLKPHAGGAFTHFCDLSGPEPVDLFRRGVAGSDDPLDSAGFPLVPFCNRVRDGRFGFRGREVRLAP